jgi:hypothetical protein
MYMYTLRPRLSRLAMVIPTRSFSCGRSALTSHLSTVHRGTIFEDRSLHLLQQDMSMSLKRVGGKEDGGIDLLGWWWLPHDSDVAAFTSASSSCLLKRRRRIRVIGQCKAEKKKMGPNYVRELEGVLYRLLTSQQRQQLQLQQQDPSSPQADMGTYLHDATLLTDENTSQPQSQSIVALLISESSFTKSTILRANSSPIPFLLLHLPPIDTTTTSLDSVSEQNHTTTPLGSVGAVWCNPALVGTQGLLKGRMEVRWERHSHGEWGRPALWWGGDRLPSWIPDLISTGNSGVDVHALDATLDIGTTL